MSRSKLLWRCRRGLLELDIVLERFLTGCYDALGAEERGSFHLLLEMPDHLLWDMIAGKIEPPDQFRAVLDKLKA